MCVLFIVILSISIPPCSYNPICPTCGRTKRTRVPPLFRGDGSKTKQAGGSQLGAGGGSGGGLPAPGASSAGSARGRPAAAAAARAGRAGGPSPRAVPCRAGCPELPGAGPCPPHARHEQRAEPRAGRGGGPRRRPRGLGGAQGAVCTLLRDVLLPHRAGQQGPAQRIQVSAPRLGTAQRGRSGLSGSRGRLPAESLLLVLAGTLPSWKHLSFIR